MEDPNTATVATANTTGNTTSLLYSPDSYALRGKVMITAVVLVLITITFLVLLLHICFRWYIHRRRTQLRRLQRRVRQQQQQHLNFATTPTPTTNEGLDPVVLNSLPVFTYSKSTSDEDEDEDENYDNYDDETEVNCAVCLCEFDEGEKGKTLPGCNHSFHVECIDMWLQSHSTCPLCRAVVELVVGKEEYVVEMDGVTESCQHGAPSSGWNLAMFMDILNLGDCLMCTCGRGGGGGDDLESGRVVVDERRRSSVEQM